MIKFEGDFEILEKAMVIQIVNEIGEIDEDIAVVNDVQYMFSKEGKDIVVKKINKIL
ncbi:hypothetical protein [Clostridium gasigenes]|uniref:Uncharacterized protein n=1 Tax=Clostridium gasigenes TaxID=94869 RepID=A0A1H0MEE8_9CLOT|nr:hypothetical protein [Clostridium gasigenes]MBB6713726.1 hypothetical protein [Clostridium gasigenes]MBU3106297.1 hypothetical protein [Clostridium gasigenes]SDO78711.1 hypothetical protein SAMN04488529_101425 [Clostridium gasigenes]